MLHSSTEINSSKPKSDQFEISLFGPGIGECIVCHIGDDKWLIVDSCLHPETKQPIALKYLKSLGIDVAKSVEIVVISHWHSDHIRGASQIVSECSEARICYPAALLKDEFLSFLSAYSGADITSIVDRKTSATKEFESIVVTLKKNCEANGNYKYEYLSPILNNTLLYESHSQNFNICIRSLSPSNKSYHNAIEQFASMIPKVKDIRTVVPIPKQNDNSIVLWIQINDTYLLLGADLEETMDPLSGWSAIVDSKQCPQGQANIFKIPHHGSINGHSDEVWHKMISDSPICMLTSKLGGRGSIPKETDIERIKSYSPNLFCTKIPKGPKVKRDRTVEKMCKGIIKDRHILSGDIGHIQVRFSKSSNIEVNHLYPAIKV
ncbi:MAG: MBL fold metallo-hydrolase [Desulfobacula sp.]|nr:MBL fold metallo-hydrolase [Desulfobacula sp.]